MDSQTPSKKNYKILMVDDSKAIRSYFKKLFELEDYTIKFSASVKEAIEVLESEEIDLVMTEYIMPEDGGDSLCLYIKKNFKGIITVVLSEIEEVNKQIDLYNLGIDRFIAKSIKKEVLIAEIDALYKRNMNLKYFYSNKVKALKSSFVTINHEINNPLTIIRSALFRLKKNYKNNENIDKYLDRINTQIDFLADHTRHFTDHNSFIRDKYLNFINSISNGENDTLSSRNVHSVLIIDDNEKISMEYKNSLERKGYRVYLSKSVKESMEFLEVAHIDATILDLSLIKEYEIDFLNHLKKNPKFRHIIAIVYSDTPSPENKVHAFKFGANLFIDKTENSDLAVCEIDAQFNILETSIVTKKEQVNIVRHIVNLYSEKINDPITIINENAKLIDKVIKSKATIQDFTCINKMQSQVNKISKILRALQTLTEVNFEKYTETSNIIKLEDSETSVS